jgi:protocatechuate 3,4-dioxygenase beta subunit
MTWQELPMSSSIAPLCRQAASVLLAASVVLTPTIHAQSVHEAPANAPSRGRLTTQSEPGQPLTVTGVVVGPDGAAIAGASLYIYQTDHEGYYGVKPASDNKNPRLKLFLRSDTRGEWSFDTVKPGSYPSSRVPAHIHFEVSAPGRSPRIFEIVFEGDPFITDRMRSDPGFSIRPIVAPPGTSASSVSSVAERIVLK